MKLTPQTYLPSTLTDAVTSGCDTCQYKYNGTWVRVEFSRGFLRVTDGTGTPVECPWNWSEVNPDACASLIGNLLLDRSRIVLWDCWSVCGEFDSDVRTTYTNIEKYTYRERYALMTIQVKMLKNPQIGVLNNYSIKAAKTLWGEPKPETCGLVFRDSMAPVGVTLKVARRYSEVPGELL